MIKYLIFIIILKCKSHSVHVSVHDIIISLFINNDQINKFYHKILNISSLVGRVDNISKHFN